MLGSVAVGSLPPAAEPVGVIEVIVGDPVFSVLDTPLPLSVTELSPVAILSAVVDNPEIELKGELRLVILTLDDIELINEVAVDSFSSPAVIGIGYHVASVIAVWSAVLVVAGRIPPSLPVAWLEAMLRDNVPVMVKARGEGKV